MTGEVGWGCGGWLCFFICFSYISLADIEIKEKYLYPVYAVNFLIISMIIMHSGGVDVLGMHTNIKSSMRYTYVSTIGNVNWAAGYLTVWLSFAAYKTFSTKKALWTALFILIIFASILIRSDSIYLSFAVLIFLLICFYYNKDSNRQFALVSFAVGIIILFILLLPNFDPFLKNLFGISRIIIDYKISLAFILLSVFLYLFGKKINKRILLIIYGVIIVILLVYMFSVSEIIDKDRMEIWRTALKCFNERFDIKMKLFGIGPELSLNIYARLSNEAGEVVLSAHSEPVQILTTMGIVGFILYLINMLNLMIKNKKNFVVLCLLLCYLAQSLFNSATPVNVLMLNMMLVLYLENTGIREENAVQHNE